MTQLFTPTDLRQLANRFSGWNGAATPVGFDCGHDQLHSIAPAQDIASSLHSAISSGCTLRFGDRDRFIDWFDLSVAGQQLDGLELRQRSERYRNKTAVPPQD